MKPAIDYKVKIDGLRFVAIMLVMLEHFVYFVGSKFASGFYGVNLFFVISGFLITSILIKDSQKSCTSSYFNFLGRRFLRIFPVYYLAIAILFIIGAEGIKQDLVYLLSYTYNYRIGYTGNWSTMYRSYWSLSVEEQFYLFFPIFVLLFRKKMTALLIVCGLFIIVADSQIVFNWTMAGKYNYVSLLTNMAPLSIGAIGAVLIKYDKYPNKLFNSLLAEVTVFLLLFLTLISGSWPIRMIMCPVFSLFLVMKASSFKFSIKPIEKILINSKVVFIGRISYGIYVYHLMVATAFTTYLFDPIWKKIPFSKFGIFSKIEFNAWIIKFPVVVLLTIAIAFLSYNYFEKPLLKLKDKYFSY